MPKPHYLRDHLQTFCVNKSVGSCVMVYWHLTLTDFVRLFQILLYVYCYCMTTTVEPPSKGHYFGTTNHSVHCREAVLFSWRFYYNITMGIATFVTLRNVLYERLSLSLVILQSDWSSQLALKPGSQCAILLLTTDHFPTILPLWPDNFSIGLPFCPSKFEKLYFMFLLRISEIVRMAKPSWIWSDKKTCQTTRLILILHTGLLRKPLSRRTAWKISGHTMEMV